VGGGQVSPRSGTSGEPRRRGSSGCMNAGMQALGLEAETERLGQLSLAQKSPAGGAATAVILKAEPLC
jgi:hypothetical protein